MVIKFVLVIAASAVISYLLGSCNSSIIVVKLLKGEDIRNFGSGNAGLTNTLRCFGKLPAALTLAGDLLKGVVAVFICKALCSAFAVGLGPDCDVHFIGYVAGFFAVIGHIFPVYYGFKGGKGVATSLGVLLMTNWQIGLICLVFALVLMALSKMVSLGSVGAAILFPVLVLFIHTNFTVSEGSSYLIYSIILAVIVAFNHRSNIKRILNGTENKLSFKK